MVNYPKSHSWSSSSNTSSVAYMNNKSSYNCIYHRQKCQEEYVNKVCLHLKIISSKAFLWHFETCNSHRKCQNVGHSTKWFTNVFVVTQYTNTQNTQILVQTSTKCRNVIEHAIFTSLEKSITWSSQYFFNDYTIIPSCHDFWSSKLVWRSW